ncbi:MAG: endoflagellar filament sheath protein [Spirochaetes bacterium]|nr:endoflagellar filament sheath protein [Spirochaetota bacterium]
MKGNHKRVTLTLLILVMAFLIGNNGINVNAVNAQDKGGGTQEKKKQKDGLVSDWLNDFEACEDWRATATCPIGDTKIRKIPGKPRPVNDEGKLVDEEGNVSQTGFKDEVEDENGLPHKNEYVLGVKTYFMDRGFDRVVVFPPNEYIIRGKAREIKVWALGRKFRHTLYVMLRDYRGRTHKLKMGRLDFWGWKEMSVIVPGWLPQSAKYAMLDMNLHFVSFVVESDKFEVPGSFYTYLDQFRVVTDLSEFTGDETIKDTW